MIGLLVTLILFPIAGCIFGRRPLAELFLLGVGITGGAMFLLGIFHVPFAVTIALVFLAGLLRCLLSLRGQASAAVLENGGDSGRDRLKPVITIVIVVPLVILAINAAIVPLNDFDGRGFWLLKAKALAHERVIDGPFFHNAIVNDPRNQYPLLMPLDSAAVMMISGDSDDREVRWLYLFTFAAVLFVIDRRVSPWCAAVLAWVPQFAVMSEGGALSAYNDMAIAAFVTCAFLDLIDGESPIRFGVWLAFLTLTKNEGLPIAYILLAIGMVTLRHRIIQSALPLLLAIAALFAWRSHIPKTDEEDYLALIRTLPEHFSRFVPAVAESGRHLFDFSKWGGFWIAGAIALAILVWKKDWRAPVTVAAIGLLYVTAYMVTLWNMRDLIEVSADRLLMHMAGPTLFAIGAVINGFARNRYSRPRYSPKPV